MQVNDSSGVPHLEDLLEAYALDALDSDEALLVEAHLETCPECADQLTRLQDVATHLSESTPQQSPSFVVQARLMRSLELTHPQPSAPTSGRSRSKISALILPAAAVLVAALFTTTLLMNLQLSNRIDELEAENATLSAQMSANATDNEKVQESLQQLRAANYLVANPSTEQYLLLPQRGASNSQGIMLVSSDGRRAVLLIAGMEEPPPPATYQAWLRRDGQQMQVGQVSVDSNGWGTLTLFTPESVYGFDWVGLTKPAPGETSLAGETVLGGRISESN